MVVYSFLKFYYIFMVCICFTNGGAKVLSTGTEDDLIIYSQEHIVSSKTAIKKTSDFRQKMINDMGSE